MKILLLNSIGQNKWGGGEKWMILAAGGLIKKGHDVYIGSRKNSIIQKKAKENNIPFIPINISSDFSFSGAFDLIRHSHKSAFDVIVGCQNRDVRISGAIKKLIGKPIVLSRQGVKLLHNSWKYKWFFNPLCDGIITNTLSIKKEYDSYNWWNDDFVKVIYNGVGISNDKDIKPADLSQYIPSNISNPKIILSAGRLSNQKGFNYLIEAAEDICKERKDVFFLIAGKGKLHSKLKSMIVSKGLEKNVLLIGFHNDLTSLFKKSDLFVLSSLYEGMPNVVMEAMANKVPVISTDVNGVSELIENNKSGIIIPPANSKKLSQSIKQFFNENKHDEIVNKAFQRINDKFSIEVMVNNLEKFFSHKIANRFQLNSFLIIQTAFIGDVILATPLIEKLKRFYPNSNIDFLLRKGNEGLLEGNPHLRNMIVFNKKDGKYKNLIRLIKQIRKNKYDLVINIQRYSTTGIITSLSGATQKVGFSKNPLSLFFTKRIYHQMHHEKTGDHEVKRNLKLIEYITDTSFEMPKLYPSKKDFESQKQEQPYYCIAPTSVWFTKQFPFEKWIKLINKLPYNHKIYLLGAKSDSQFCEKLIHQVEHPNVINNAGKITLLQSAALMKNATMNYVNDSAPLHITSAMNCPVRAIFCSTVPAFGYTPLSDNSKIIEVTEKLSCRPCGLHGKKSCPLGHFKCSDIEIDRIIN
ncbi:MAG: glycosyltransferase [Marinilabiliaceae bacterium]|nr:glycosyltransferase [Marinilabiliaceae bacterium]